MQTDLLTMLNVFEGDYQPNTVIVILALYIETIIEGYISNVPLYKEPWNHSYLTVILNHSIGLPVT